MEPVDFGGALLRRWWLLLVLGLVGLLVGLALPVSHHSGHSSPLSWSTTAIVGASPPGGPGGGGALAGGVTTSQISFYAHTDQVMLAAAKQAGRTGSLTELEREITVTADTTKKACRRRREHDQDQRHRSDPRSIGCIYECFRKSARGLHEQSGRATQPGPSGCCQKEGH